MGDTNHREDHTEESREAQPPGTAARGFFAERLATALLAGGFALLGWMTLWQGGILIKGKSGAGSFVQGSAGRALAAFFFCAAALGLLLFLRSFKPGRLVNTLALAVLLIPPLFFMMARH